MDITKEELEAVASGIIASYQDAVDEKLSAFLSEEKFDYFFSSSCLGGLYEFYYGRLFGLIDVLMLGRDGYFSSKKQLVRAFMGHLLVQSALNSRVLLDISEARRQGKDSEKAVRLGLTLNNSSNFCPLN